MHISLRTPVGDGHENDPRDIADLQKSLVAVGAISPNRRATRSPEILTPEIDMAVSSYQADRGLKVDGQLHPGGPTERAINNDLAGKPRGAALAAPTGRAVTPKRVTPFKLGLQDGVGEGEPNPVGDVKRMKQALGALGLMAEDPFDDPRPFLDGTTNKALLKFQRDNGLKPDALARPGGPTERALNAVVTANLVQRAPEIADYWQRTGEGGSRLSGKRADTGSGRIQTVGFVPGRPDAIDDGISSGQPTEGPEPAQGILVRRYGTPLPPLYIPSKEDLQRIRRDIARIQLTVPYPGLGRPTITYGPNPDDEWPKKQATPKGPDPDKERSKKVVPEGYPADGPKIPDLEGFQANERKHTIMITPDDYGIRLPIVVENSRGDEFTQRNNTTIAEWLVRLGEIMKWKIEHVAGGYNQEGKPIKEFHLPGRDALERGEDSRKGANRSDITLRITIEGREFLVHINTYDRLKSLEPDARERRNAMRLIYNMAKGHLLIMIPKLRKGERYDRNVFESTVLEILRRVEKGVPHYDPNNPATKELVMKHVKNIIAP